MAEEEMSAEPVAATPSVEQDAAPDEMTEILDPMSEPEGVQFDQTPDQPVNQLADPDEKLLFGPSNRPDQPLNAVRPHSRQPAPPNMSKVLPYLVEGAKDPDAPPQLRQLVKILNYHMNRG